MFIYQNFALAVTPDLNSRGLTKIGTALALAAPNRGVQSRALKCKGLLEPVPLTNSIVDDLGSDVLPIASAIDSDFGIIASERRLEIDNPYRPSRVYEVETSLLTVFDKLSGKRIASADVLFGLVAEFLRDSRLPEPKYIEVVRRRTV